jgi:hypothetical protein
MTHLHHHDSSSPQQIPQGTQALPKRRESAEFDPFSIPHPPESDGHSHHSEGLEDGFRRLLADDFHPRVESLASGAASQSSVVPEDDFHQ